MYFVKLIISQRLHKMYYEDTFEKEGSLGAPRRKPSRIKVAIKPLLEWQPVNLDLLSDVKED